MAIEYRLGIEQDDVPTYHVFAEANRELFNRRGMPDTFGPDPPVRMMAFRGYAREYHGDGYWVAYDGDRMVGFGIGVPAPRRLVPGGAADTAGVPGQEDRPAAAGADAANGGGVGHGLRDLGRHAARRERDLRPRRDAAVGADLRLGDIRRC